MKREKVQIVQGYGARLRERLKAAKLTQLALARAIGRSRQTVSNAMSDKVSESTARLIDDVLPRLPTDSPNSPATGLARASSSIPIRTRSDVLATANQLVDWFGRQAQEDLPRLVRNLVRVLTDDAKLIQFRAGDGVQQHGYDGRVQSESGSLIAPVGYSVWELGSGQNPSQKAETDYQTRTANPADVDIAKSTFVFVTTRRWDGKDAWAAKKRGERAWRDVRAFDADDIETWLEAARSVHVWLSIRMGIKPDACQDLESWWINWQHGTRPHLSADFLLAGRDKQAKELATALADRKAILAIKSESPEESIAVLAAFFEKQSPDERDALFARSLVVESEGAWRHLVAAKTPLILIPAFDATELVSTATSVGHTVVIALGTSGSDDDDSILVPPIDREPVVEFLRAADPRLDDNAWDHASLARRSMKAFRRLIALAPSMRTPAWAQPSEARSMIAPLFLGAWNGQRDGDRQAVELLARSPHSEVADRLAPYTNTTDPFLRSRGSLFYLVSHEDAWRQLGRFVTLDDLERFAAVALNAFDTPDPSLDLEPDKRWMAGVLLPPSHHSGKLRKGIATTIAFLGSRSGPNGASLGNPILAGFAEGLVKKILELTRNDLRLWVSISDFLPDLAEAAPDVFLSELNRAAQSEDFASVIFTDAESGTLFGPSSAHVDFLWALERLAWSQEYLGMSVRALDTLDQIDPRGKLTNRPLASLRAIFLPWLPQTAAPVEKRLAVLESWANDKTRAVWETLLSMLPEFHGIGHHNPRPRWREWLPDKQREVTNGEYYRSVRFAGSKLLALAGGSGERWKAIVEALPRFAEPDHEIAVSKIGELNPADFGDEDRRLIWDALRELVAQHQNHSDAAWAMAPDKLLPIARQRDRFVPEDVVAKHSWLFAHMPDLPDARTPRTEFREYAEEVLERQIAAVGEVLADRGMDGLLEVARRAVHPYAVGWSLGKSGLLQDPRDFLNANLAHEDSAHDIVARAYLNARSSSLAPDQRLEWFRDLYAKQAKDWEATKRARILLALPAEPATWALLDGNETIEKEYWSRLYSMEITESDAAVGAREFTRFGRPLSAVAVLGHYVEKAELNPRLVLDVMNAAVLTDHAERPDQMFTYYAEKLLDFLSTAQGIEEFEVGRLEWGLLPVFSRRERSPKVLQRVFLRDPSIFIDAIESIYKRHNEVRDEFAPIDEAKRARAHRAYDLLHAIHGIPGTGPDGTIDAQALQKWVDDAKALLVERGRYETGMTEIGQILGRSSLPDVDGVWPSVAVRMLVETMKDEHLEQGIVLGHYNSRGVTTRGLTDGGKQERAAAARFMGFASAVTDRWPRTAAMLREMAAGYEREANREDLSVAIQEDLGST